MWKPFDRYAHLQQNQDQSLDDLLASFKQWRTQNMATLRGKRISLQDLEKTGIHPSFGSVTLAQLLAAWVVHDLNHICQITRVMAYQYKREVGPWIQYLGILNRPNKN